MITLLHVIHDPAMGLTLEFQQTGHPPYSRVVVSRGDGGGVLFVMEDAAALDHLARLLSHSGATLTRLQQGCDLERAIEDSLSFGSTDAGTRVMRTDHDARSLLR